LLTFLLASCLSEIPVAAGPNRPPLGDADVDVDADTDTDSQEDCTNGLDDDADGQVDCEDSDCVDVCFEDCGDGEDNDGDGAVDCEDDECAGAEGCGIVWTITAETWTERAYIAYGPDIMEWHGYPALLWMRGEIGISGTSSEGGSFQCEGDFDVGPPAWDRDGTWWEEGSCEDCDFRWVMRPKVEDGTLKVNDDCPVETLQATRIGAFRGRDDLTAILDGDWQVQYLSEQAGWGWDNSDGHEFKWAGFWYMEQAQPRSWQVELE